MLSGVRRIASAAARSVRAGGCTPGPRQAAHPAGQRNFVGFVRFLSAPGAAKDIPARKIRLTYADVRSKLQVGPLMTGIEVDVSPDGHHDCFLETQQFQMCYLTPQQPWSYGNVSLNWILTQDSIDKEAFRFSNYVTERANEPGAPPGTPEKHLETATQVTSGVYTVQVLGSGLKFYVEPEPGVPINLAICTYLNGDPANADKYYLQPTVGDNSLVAKIGNPQYIFGFVPAQPLPTIT